MLNLGSLLKRAFLESNLMGFSHILSYDFSILCEIEKTELIISFEGNFVNGTTLVVDGGIWLSKPRHMSKEAVKQVSKVAEKRSRDAPVGVPKSNL